MSGAELRDQMFALSDVSCVDRALQRVRDAADDQGRVALAIAALLECLPQAHSPHMTAPRAVAMVNAGSDSVRRMAAALGTTVRTVQQAFQNEIGMSPKTLMRIARLQRAANIVRGGAGMTLSRIALAAGYYDHAHFTHDCRDIAGLTPSELFGARSELTEVFLDRGVA